MAARIEDLTGAPRSARGGAVVYKFPTEQVRARAARQRAAQRRRNRAMVRRRRAALALVALGTVVVTLLGGGPDGSSVASNPQAPATVVIQPGETLWDVAEAHAPSSIDPRAYVDAIVALNDLGPTLPSGLEIRLP
jgi:Tfp pilus assembly protein FimV